MKYRMLNPFITKDGVLHTIGELVELDEEEVKVGLSFRAIEAVPIETKQIPSMVQPFDPPKTETKQENPEPLVQSQLQTQPTDSTLISKADDVK